NPRDVTRQFDRVPLADALVRLLGEQNFTLRYGSEGKLRKISLLGEPLAAAAQTTAADASNPDKPASGRRHRHHHDVRSSRETPEGQKARTVLEDFAANHPSGHSNQKANDILNRAPGGANAAPPGRR